MKWGINEGFFKGKIMENESENSPSLRQHDFFEDFEWRDQRGGFLKDEGHGKTSRIHRFDKICFLKAKKICFIHLWICQNYGWLTWQTYVHAYML